MVDPSNARVDGAEAVSEPLGGPPPPAAPFGGPAPYFVRCNACGKLMVSNKAGEHVCPMPVCARCRSPDHHVSDCPVDPDEDPRR